MGGAHRDQAVGQLLPIAVARKIVVGDEEPRDAAPVMLVDAAFEIVRAAVAALPALHVDDRAERALIGAAAPEIDAGERAGGAPDGLLGGDRHRPRLAAPPALPAGL